MSDASSSAIEIAVQQIDDQLTHLWMVRTFIKHSEEAVDDADLKDIAQKLYDFVVAFSPAKRDEEHDAFIAIGKKNWGKLKAAAEFFDEIQPEVSTHTNFEMANRSLQLAVSRVGELLQVG